MKPCRIAVSVIFCIATTYALQDDLNRLLGDIVKQDTASGKAVVAVLPFVSSSEQIDAGLGRSIAEYAVAFLFNQQKYTIVERMDFARVAQELALSQTDMVDQDKLLQMGKMLSANRIVPEPLATHWVGA